MKKLVIIAVMVCAFAQAQTRSFHFDSSQKFWYNPTTTSFDFRDPVVRGDFVIELNTDLNRLIIDKDGGEKELHVFGVIFRGEKTLEYKGKTHVIKHYNGFDSLNRKVDILIEDKQINIQFTADDFTIVFYDSNRVNKV